MSRIPDQSPDVTALLLAWRGGDEAALGRIVPLVQDELRKIARRCLRGEQPDQQPAGNGARQRGVPAPGRCPPGELAEPGPLSGDVSTPDAAGVGGCRPGPRLRTSGAAMRSGCHCRRPRAVPTTWGAMLSRSTTRSNSSEQVDARKGRLVELRFFAGLSVEEAAVVLEISPQTAARDWTFAKAWLRRELAPRLLNGRRQRRPLLRKIIASRRAGCV